MTEKIFIIDDEEDIREILSFNLKETGYAVSSYASAMDALNNIQSNKPDLIILDIMMDGMDGLEFCRTIRGMDEHKNIPIIFLSAKSGEIDKILGLEFGGDDYISKPFSIKELISRVKAVLRRTAGAQGPPAPARLNHRGVEIYPDQYSLKIDGSNVKVTKTEFELLHLFMKYPNKIFSRDNIIDSLRGDNVFVIDRTIDVHVMNLRKKLGPYKYIITTFSGVGYGFKEE